MTHEMLSFSNADDPMPEYIMLILTKDNAAKVESKVLSLGIPPIKFLLLTPIVNICRNSWLLVTAVFSLSKAVFRKWLLPLRSMLN
jgi:hypothetical protein